MSERLTRNFWDDEFICRCGCGLNNIKLRFVEKLQELRDAVSAIAGRDVVFNPSSGCRCPAHNKKEGGADNSGHLYGIAADIECTDSYIRFLIITQAARLGFKRIGIQKTFIHLDIAGMLPQPRAWVY